MSHEGHRHVEAESMSASRFAGATLLNLAITGAQLVGGIFSGSLALLSDALHNFSDGFSLVVSYLSLKVSRRARNRHKTFGYKRAGILAALINSVVLIAISIFLLKEALFRLFQPSEVQGGIVFAVAAVCFVGNLLSVLLLHRGAKHSLNVRSSYLHLLGDTLASVGVLVGGLLIALFHLNWIDPVLSIAIGLYIFWEVYRLLRTTMNILMQGAPEGFRLAEIEAAVRRVDNVFNIHHVHVWSLDEHELFLEAHINLKNDMPVSKTPEVLQRITQLLQERFEIAHTTFQVEFECCPGVGAIVEEGYL